MKNLFLSLVLTFLAIGLYAQQTFSYQAVVRNSSGQILQNQAVSFQISIRSMSPTGTIVFQETHNSITTNEFGLVNLEIGDGTPAIGDLNSPAWGEYDYYLEVELDISGGTSYQVMGTTQLLYVPLAMYAQTSTSADTVLSEGQELSLSGNDLSISGSGGNTINLPFDSLPSGGNGDMLMHDGSSWTASPLLFHGANQIGLGTTTPTGFLNVSSSSLAEPSLNVYQGLTTDGSIAIRAKNPFNNYGYLGVFGSDDFEGFSALDIAGFKIGVLGLSTLSNSGYGVFGYAKKYGGYFENSSSGNNVSLGGADAALEVDGAAVFGTNTNAISVTDMIELTGTTDATIDYTDITLPTGWDAENTRIISFAVKYANSMWYGNGLYHPSTGIYVSATLSITQLRLLYNNDSNFKSIPYRVTLMKIQ